MNSMRTFYAMKNRRGGETMSPRDKFLMHRMHACPGNIHHNIARRDIVFARRLRHGHACYVMYWRSHPGEYEQFLESCATRQTPTPVV